MVRALPFRTPARLDFGRVMAIAAAISLHVLALLLLLMPMAAPQLAPVIEERIPLPLLPKEVKPTPLPPEIVKKQPEPRKTPAPQPQVLPNVPETNIAPTIDQGTLPATDNTVVDAPTGDIAPPDTSPMVGSQLQYVVAPPPPYPRAEQRTGIQGTVMLRVLVDTDGKPLEVVVETSSGNRSLDRAALQHVQKHWRFKPAVRDGVVVQAYGLVPIAFTLQ